MWTFQMDRNANGPNENRNQEVIQLHNIVNIY